MSDLSRIFCWGVDHELRRKHADEIIQLYYDTIKSLAGNKFPIGIQQLKKWFDANFSFQVIFILAILDLLCEKFSRIYPEDQREEAKQRFLRRMKANYDDAIAIYDTVLRRDVAKL